MSTEASNHQHLAALHQSRGELALAHQHIGKALEIAREQGSPSSLAASLAAMGEITYAYGKDAEAALVYFQEGLALAEQHNDHASISTIHRSLGTIAADRQQYETARRHLEIALAETEQVEDRSQADEIRAALAQLPPA
ncbi:MAG TPA: tetratricopeptide repeat protein [Roseiflexaceae bacterium]|nr:tetratricopeptide repeat protein [Roseiflexaceae bacterium]